MSKYSLGVLAAAAMFLMTIAPVTGQRNGGAADLPEGPGKEAVAQECTKCPGVNNITNSWGATEKDWREGFGFLVSYPPQTAQPIVSAPAQKIPPKARPPRNVVVPAGP